MCNGTPPEHCGEQRLTSCSILTRSANQLIWLYACMCHRKWNSNLRVQILCFSFVFGFETIIALL